MQSDSLVNKTTLSQGSSLYYALLFATPLQRDAIVKFVAFEREIKRITLTTHEPQIALIKLKWWTDEIKRIFEGNSQHPIGRALLGVIKQYQLLPSFFEGVVIQAKTRLSHPTFQTFEQLSRFCKLGAARVHCHSHIMSFPDPPPLAFVQHLALSLQLIQFIQYFGKDCSQGQIFIPNEELQSALINEKQLFMRQIPKANRIALLTNQAQRAKAAYQDALHALPDSLRGAQKSLLILANIQMALLKEIERSQFDVLHQKISLTPFKKCWIAWVSHLKEKKYQRKMLCETLT